MSITYGPGIVATGVATTDWSADWVAPGDSRKLPTTTSNSSKAMFQPSTNTGSPALTGWNGRPCTPSVSPEHGTSIHPGLLGAVLVETRSQRLLKVMPEPRS